MKRIDIKSDEQLKKSIYELDKQRIELINKDTSILNAAFHDCLSQIAYVTVVFAVIWGLNKFVGGIIFLALIGISSISSNIRTEKAKKEKYRYLRNKYFNLLLSSFLSKFHPQVKGSYSSKFRFYGSKIKSIYSSLKIEENESYTLKYRKAFIGVSDTTFRKSMFRETTFTGNVIKITLIDKDYPKTEVRTFGNFGNLEDAKITGDEFQPIGSSDLHYKTSDEYIFQKEIFPLIDLIQELSNKLNGIRIFLEGSEIVILTNKTPFTLDDTKIDIYTGFNNKPLGEKIARKINTLLYLVDTLDNPSHKSETEERLELKIFEPIKLDNTKL